MPFGTPKQAEEVLAEYGMSSELFQSETEALLAALLMEKKAERHQQGGPQDIAYYLKEEEQMEDLETSAARATYRSESLTLAAGDGWTELELAFTTTEVDLRNISGPIEVAFADPSTDRHRVQYDSGDSPVAGIGVRTSRIWVKENSDADEKVDLEAWA